MCRCKLESRRAERECSELSEDHEHRKRGFFFYTGIFSLLFFKGLKFMASAKNSQYDDPPVYVALEGGQPIVAEQAQQPAFAYYVVPVEPRKRKQCGCGCCCLRPLFLASQQHEGGSTVAEDSTACMSLHTDASRYDTFHPYSH